jgi:hypothetical protein
MLLELNGESSLLSDGRLLFVITPPAAEVD